MSTFHRNFEFARPPIQNQRPGNFLSPAQYQVDGVTPNTPLLIGAPVYVNTSVAADSVYGLQPVLPATSELAPVPGLSGICIFEFKNDEAYAGFDPYLTGWSDLAFVPPSQAIQMVSGTNIEVRFRNTSALTFLNTRTYPARTMVAGFGGATNTVNVGTYLSPGTGNDASGYWQPQASATGAWLVVTAINTTGGEVTARMLF